MKEWLHEDFLYLRETAFFDREKHVESLKIQFNARAAINEAELLYGHEDMMAFSHLKKKISKSKELLKFNFIRLEKFGER